MVIVELIFVFGVGISCILFSINLVKTLRVEEAVHTQSFVTTGNFPPPLSSPRASDRDGRFSDKIEAGMNEDVYNIIRNSESKAALLESDEVFSPRSSVDGGTSPTTAHTPNTFYNVLKTFTPYVKFW